MRKTRLRMAAACLLAASAWPSLAAQPAMELRHEALRTWTTEQGLPQDFITAIQQTPDGFLWVGTHGGLARFDGVSFRTFPHDGPAALRHTITGLAVDRAGTLWIGSTVGLFCYKDGAFRSVPLAGAREHSIEEIRLSGVGNGLWVRTKETVFHVNEKGVAERFQPQTDSSHPLLPQAISSFLEDKAGTLWLADRQGVVAVSNSGATRRYPLLNATLLYQAPDGQILAGNGHRLFRFTGQKFAALPKQGPDEFVQVLVDRRGQLWMASGGLQGLSRFAGGKLEMLNEQSGIASNDVRVLFEDRDGDMWIGTISGLQRLHRGAFLSYTKEDGLASSQYDAIFEDRGGAIWTGSLEAGIARLDGDKWRKFGVSQGLRSGQVRGFAEGDRSPIVAIADYGLFAEAAGQYRKLPGIPAGYLCSPLRMADGSLWFSVLHKGVFRLQRGVITAYGAADGLTDNEVWALRAESDGTLWAGSRTGAFRWNGQRWQHDVATSFAVYAIEPSRRGGVFLGTANGLMYHKGNANWVLTQENGLPGDGVFSLSEGAQGDLWVSTTRGICRIPKDQLDAVTGGRAAGFTPEIFTEDDGLRSRTVLPVGQVAQLRARDGRIWFATVTGPAVAQLGSTATATPHAVVDEVSVDEGHFSLASLASSVPLAVKPGQHRIVFTFTAPVFIAPEQIRFRYRLLGWNNGWVNADTVREAAYMGLAPGKYTFQVQAASRTGEFGPVSQAVALNLEPFFWQTRLFLFLVLAVLGAAVAEITRRRTLAKARKLNLRFEERAAERERIASQIHDTFLQDLTGAALQLELVGLQLDEDPAIAKQSVGNLAQRMREMIARSRDIVSNLHSMAGSHETLFELLSHIEAEFRLAEAPTFLLHTEGAPCPLHPFLRDEVYGICREAVANAFRHAEAGAIEVKVRFLAQKLVVEIRDDGVGMSEELRQHGRAGHFGLSGMQAHARRIEASLRIESAPGAGTRITLEASLHRAHTAFLGFRFRKLR